MAFTLAWGRDHDLYPGGLNGVKYTDNYQAFQTVT